MATTNEVAARFWTDDVVRTLPAAAKLVFLYLLTGPGADGAGLVRFYVEPAADDTGLTPKAVEGALECLVAAGRARWDRDRHLLWLVKRLHYRTKGSLSEPQAKGLVRRLEDCPQESQVFREFVEHYRGLIDSLPEGIGKGFLKGFDEAMAKPTPEPIAEGSRARPSSVLRPLSSILRPKTLSLAGSPSEPGTPEGTPEGILSYLNEQAKRGYRAVPANLDLIRARLKDGLTPDQLRAVVARKVAEWGTDAKMQKFLRPETLFNKTKCEQYVGDLTSPAPFSSRRINDAWKQSDPTHPPPPTT